MTDLDRYRFQRRIHVDASPADIFPALVETHDWVRWWDHLESVETLAGPPDDPTRRTDRYVVRAPVGYRIEVHGWFVTVDPPQRLEAHLAGDLEGSGRLELHPAPGGTTDLHYLLDVRTTRRWMRLLAPMARPLFERNHHRVLSEAFAGLARRLETRGDRDAT